jgi:DNA-binding NtrC family response regulator
MGQGKKTGAALIVHGDLGVLSGLQDALLSRGISVITARDLPTALLSATRHYFDLLLVSSRVNEEGDGWPLAGVMHMIFPRSYIAVIAPDRNVISLQSAINYGANQVFEFTASPVEIVGAILQRMSPVARSLQ